MRYFTQLRPARLSRRSCIAHAITHKVSISYFLAVLVIAFGCAGTASAQVDASLDQARRLLASKDAGGAYALLEPLEIARAGQPDFDYLLGIAALDSGRISRAIFALERVLAVQPENALARAEIGRAYVAAGETETAREELTNVRASPIPPAAVPAVDRLLGAISQLQAQQTTQWRAYLDAGVGHDSNVNSATGDSQVAVPALGGLVVNIDAASRRAQDSFAVLGGGANLRVPIAPDLAFVGNIAAAQTFNRDQNRFETGVLDASAGLSKIVGDSVFSGALQASSNWIGGNRFRKAIGVLGQWQYNLDARSQTTVFAQSTRLSFPGNSIRDADRWVVGAGYAKAVAAGPVVFASGYGGREDARASGVPHLGHRLAGMRTGFQWQTAESLTVFGNLNFEDRRYNGDEPLFGTLRHDRQSALVAGLHYMITAAWRLTPQMAYTSNRSNIPIYDFQRVVTSLTLRREF